MKKNNNLSPLESPTANAMEMQAIVSPAASKATAAATAAATRQRTTSIHVTALDGIVNVNSLFTMAIFIGFSLTVPAAASAATTPECHATTETVRRLIIFEVCSFSFFLFSSLLAQSMKLAINLLNNADPNDALKADVDTDLLKWGLFGSAIGSVTGCVFLVLSIIDFIQVKLGRYSCGGHTIFGVVVLVVFVGFALVVYIVTAVYAAFFVQVNTPDDD